MRKIIFLDMDGVLANGKYVQHDGMWGIDPDCQHRLGRVLRETGAELVISSSWRMRTIEETVAHFKERGFAYCEKITGVTIRGYQYLEKRIALSIPRGIEIKQWMDHNIHSGGNGVYDPERNGTYVRATIGVDYNYVILDDDSDMLLEQGKRFVQCDGNIGLTDELAEKAIGILNGNVDGEGVAPSAPGQCCKSSEASGLSANVPNAVRKAIYRLEETVLAGSPTMAALDHLREVLGINYKMGMPPDALVPKEPVTFNITDVPDASETPGQARSDGRGRGRRARRMQNRS